MKILIIEDTDTKFLDIQQSLLRYLSIDITRKKSRNGGLLEIRRAYRENNMYDLLILDQVMPLFEEDRCKMLPDGGFSVLNEIKRLYIDLPVCMCSSEEISREDIVMNIKYSPFVSLDNDIDCLLKK